MGNLSTFGTFTMARLGIYVSQHALNVTGNNISNINTKGYTRQALDQSSMNFGSADRYQSRFDIRENGGVLAKGVNQMRDQYLDIRYRNEMTKVGESDSKLDGLRQLSAIFDEVAKGEDGEGVLEARFNDLRQQLELLHSQGAGQDDIDSIVRASAEALAIQFNDYSKQLETLAQNKTAQFKQDIDAVNATLTKIRDLNETIRKSQVFGGAALTQRDERNVLIDKLSESIGINVIYESEDLGDGVEVEKLKITTSGDPSHTLIDGIYGAQLSLLNETNYDLGISELKSAIGKRDPDVPNGETDGDTIVGFQTLPQTPPEDMADRVVFAQESDAQAAAALLNGDPSYYLDPTDASKGFYYDVAADPVDPANYVIHQHRIDYGATEAAREAAFNAQTPAEKNVFLYTSFTVETQTKIGDTELSGGLQATRELLTEKGEYASAEDVAVDPDASTKRGIRYYQRSLDTLARSFAKVMNEANTMPDDQIYRKNDEGLFCDENGVTLADQADRSKFVLKEAYSYYNGGPLFSNSGNSDDTEGITAANISVAHSWARGAAHVLRSKEPYAQEVSREQSNLAHFVAMLGADHKFTNGTEGTGSTYFEGTFQEMLTDTIAGSLAKDQSITETMLSNYNSTADELYVDRDAVMGVDLNDEAMNMMQFQKAYSAACRLMTTYDGMLEKLINGTAV
jgi:flagellar hook-associated protein 1 FlgK